jgi:hypothetical protein
VVTLHEDPVKPKLHEQLFWPIQVPLPEQALAEVMNTPKQLIAEE